ncbi:MAG: hypothetical protein AAGM22_27925 [Acidobacteriota bacterium]
MSSRVAAAEIESIVEIPGRGGVVGCRILEGQLREGLTLRAQAAEADGPHLTLWGIDALDRSDGSSLVALSFFERPPRSVLETAIGSRKSVELFPAPPRRRLRLAFDLDDTLILPGLAGSESQDCPWLTRLLFGQSLRPGTVQLLRRLGSAGHDLWIYTTSYRSPWRIATAFRAAGIRLGSVVNQTRHERTLASLLHPPAASKFPPAFGIDLLVDDSLGVEQEGKRFGFEVCRVDPADPFWVESVTCAVGLATYRRD